MIPPAGVPLKIREIFKAIRTSFDKDAVEKFRQGLCDYLKVKYVFFVSSGRAALTLILRVLAEHSYRNEVIIPAYTSFSVPSAVVRAGLKIRLCDINYETLDFDYSALEKADHTKVLCIIPSNLCGLVSNVPGINRIAKTHGVWVIDDAAQSLGASLDGEKSGTMGDVGLLSLARGKIISSYEGGIIVTNSDEIAQRLGTGPLFKNGRQFPPPNVLLKLFCYSLFLHPQIYWIPSQLPFLKLGVSKFDQDFTIEGLSRVQISIASFMFKGLGCFNKRRRENTQRLIEGIMENSGLIIPQALKNSCPVYLRFPLLVMSQRVREAIYTNLLENGIGVTRMYPSGIHRIQGIGQYLVNGEGRFPQADLAASFLLTLPTHPLLRQREIGLMIDTVNQYEE